MDNVHGNDTQTPSVKNTSVLTPITIKKQPDKKDIAVLSPTLVDAGDGFFHSYGVTPGSDNKPHSHCMPRVLEVTCTLLEILTPRLHNTNLYISVYLKNEFRRKILKSQVIQIPKSNTSTTNIEKYEIPINTVFHMQYMHHVKKRIDALEISIKANKIKKKRDSMNDISELQSTETKVSYKKLFLIEIDISRSIQNIWYSLC
jgi:hypothetical protein